MKCDYHMHSCYSHDSNTPMTRQAERAVKLGLDEICFTDHVDFYGVDLFGGDAADKDYSGYFSEIEQLREKFRGKLTVRAGHEFGLQSHTTAHYEALYAKYRDKYDFILLSVHEINDLGLWGHDYQHGKTQAEYTRGYYEEILRIMQSYHDYSVLAHLDLITRYERENPYPFEGVRDLVREILTRAIDEGKGIELNTSSWRYGLRDTTPCREILELYHELGGEVLTLGSDAHNPEYLADHMDTARNILKGIGFTKFCTFEKMRPIFHAL